MNLELRGVSLPLHRFTLECDVTLHGGVTGLLGPSGSGKTSLLNLIAGLRRPERGLVRSEGVLLSDAASGFFMPARQRRIGYVPQDLALFPHLDVRRNLLYGWRDRGVAPERIFELPHVVAALELTPLLERSVGALSGGEQHRVALGRALLSSPRLLLLDEPLSSLDAPLKRRVMPFLQRVRDEFCVPMIYVSHDAQEVAALCDEAVMICEGRITTLGAPAEVLPPAEH